RCDARVATGALGLRERAVRDLVYEVGLEVEVVVVELDEIAFGETLQQRGRVAAVGQLQHRRDRAVRADDRAVFEQGALGGVERVEAGGQQPVQGGRDLADAGRVA